MKIKAFFDQNTFTVSYIVIDEETKKCAIIDSVLDYDIFSGTIKTNSADTLIAFIKDNNLQLDWILETHIHADHISAADYIKNKAFAKAKIAIGEGIFEVLKYWVKEFNIDDEVPVNGSQFDHIFKDKEIFKIGNLQAKFITTPGHTPACGSYIIEDSVFVGDLMFMPNVGTGRADFPGGNAREQFISIQKIFSLQQDTQIFTAHDYPKDGQTPSWQSTVEKQQQENILAKIDDEQKYTQARQVKDRNLAVPKLIFPAIQLNLRAGKMPEPENNGLRYIKIPLNFAK